MKAKTPKNEKNESKKCKWREKWRGSAGVGGRVCRVEKPLGYLSFLKKKRAKKWVRCYNIGVERSGKKISRSREKQVIFRSEGVLDMTAIFVFAALIIASVAYSVFDGRRAEAARRMDDFYRVEFKKSYVVKDEIAAQNWYWSFAEWRNGWLRPSVFLMRGKLQKMSQSGICTEHAFYCFLRDYVHAIKLTKRQWDKKTNCQLNILHWIGK